MTRIVLDTNVIVSSLISRSGREAQLLKSVSRGDVQPCFSAPILAEYRTVCDRPKLSHFIPDANSLVDKLVSVGLLIAATPSGLHSPDASDTMFIDCAVAAQAHFLVTGNKRHFPEPLYGPAEVVNAATLLARLSAQSP